MTYSSGYPVRLAGGRLALDFINTADWSAEGAVVHEKIEDRDDLTVWLRSVGLPEARAPEDIEVLHRFRLDLRKVIGVSAGDEVRDVVRQASSLNPTASPDAQPLISLIAVSALSILTDPRERDRIKMCPGVDCGWFFVDETKNRRRKWCFMETCGNRAKSMRHYAKTVNAKG